MQKGPDDPDLCSPDGRLSSSHYTPRGLFHFKYRQSYNKSILPRRGLLRKGKRDPDHRWRGAAWRRFVARLAACWLGAGLPPLCRQARWLGSALSPGSLARRRSGIEPTGVARTCWRGAALASNPLAWRCFDIEPTGMVPLCRRARRRGTGTPPLPGWPPLLLGWIRFPL